MLAQPLTSSALRSHITPARTTTNLKRISHITHDSATTKLKRRYVAEGDNVVLHVLCIKYMFLYDFEHTRNYRVAYWISGHLPPSHDCNFILNMLLASMLTTLPMLHLREPARLAGHAKASWSMTISLDETRMTRMRSIGESPYALQSTVRDISSTHTIRTGKRRHKSSRWVQLVSHCTPCRPRRGARFRSLQWPVNKIEQV